MKRIAAIVALSAITAFGGPVAAGGDYPPGGPTSTTATAGGVSGPRRESSGVPAAESRAAVALAATGSDNGTALKIAGGGVVAGLGLLALAKFRRRPVTA